MNFIFRIFDHREKIRKKRLDGPAVSSFGMRLPRLVYDDVEYNMDRKPL